MKPLTQEIDRAIDALKRAGMECTPDRVKVNVRVAVGEIHELAEKALDRAIVDRLKARSEIITDSAPRLGGRPRADYWATTVSEHEEQLRIQKQNVTYVTNQMRAEEQAIQFARLWEEEHGYKPPFLEIADDVDRIYRMNGCVAPKRVAA